MNNEQFLDAVKISLYQAIYNQEHAKKTFQSEWLKTFSDIRINQFKEALRFANKLIKELKS